MYKIKQYQTYNRIIIADEFQDRIKRGKSYEESVKIPTINKLIELYTMINNLLLKNKSITTLCQAVSVTIKRLSNKLNL